MALSVKAFGPEGQMLHAQGHFSFPSLLPDYCQLPAGPGAHSCCQGIPRCLFHAWQVCACMLHVFHVLLLPAGQDCPIRDQPAPAVLAGSCKVQTLHQMGKPWPPGEVGTSPPMIHASSQAAPQHKAHTCMTQHSTCLSCWSMVAHILGTWDWAWVYPK